MTYYGYEGWRISGDTDDFHEAVKIREEYMGNGNSDVAIFRSVVLEVREKDDELSGGYRDLVGVARGSPRRSIDGIVPWDGGTSEVVGDDNETDK